VAFKRRQRGAEGTTPGAILSAPRRLRLKATFQCLQAHLPAFQAGTGISKRPFTLPKRLSVSEPPFQGRSSRPTSSTPCETFVEPVRFLIPLRDPVSPGARKIVIKNPLPDFCPAVPTVPRISTPLWGLSDPSGSKRSIRFPAVKLTFRTRPIACHSPAPDLFY